ncbi:MAG: HIT domain-containing protein [Dehalococcoidia bacterium]|nr:HIT domain-containing protein [Dehalococcoidia bacterium]
MSECLFCRVASGEVAIEKLYEDELVVAFDIPPGYPGRQAPVHFLVISREHVPSAAAIRDEHGLVVARMFAAIARVAEEMGVAGSGYRVATNVGDDAGQTEYHLHLHCLGGRKLGAKG